MTSHHQATSLLIATVMLHALSPMPILAWAPHQSHFFHSHKIHRVGSLQLIVPRTPSSVVWAVKIKSDEEATAATPTTTAILPSNASPAATTTRTTISKQPATVPPRGLDVSSEVDLPFPAELAYDSFSNLTRQPEWSPWLYSVEYLEPTVTDLATDQSSPPSASTKWTLKVMGVSYSWISIATKQDRPYVIEWESVSGLKNFGRVQFTPLLDDDDDDDGTTNITTTCRMNMSMTFVPPRIVAALFRNPKGVQRFMERKLIGSSLRSFRDVVIDTTLGGMDNATLFFPI